VFLFIALYYALVVLPPDSALFDFPTAETVAGLATVLVAVALVVIRFLPKRRLHFERLIYAGFLAAMPFIYFAAALTLGSSFDVAIELVGVPVFVGLAMFGYYNGFWPLGLVSSLMALVGTSGIKRNIARVASLSVHHFEDTCAAPLAVPV
jgi:hypothetical protein